MWDDVWLPLGAAAGHIPVVYPYIVDNLGEALTASGAAARYWSATARLRLHRRASMPAWPTCMN
jgi:hypothetical protein